jgi:hypothetical protein
MPRLQTCELVLLAASASGNERKELSRRAERAVTAGTAAMADSDEPVSPFDG